MDKQIGRISNYSENDNSSEIRELTDTEKQYYKETLVWTDKQIEKCTIDENGIIHYKTDNENLEGKTHESSGVVYERKAVEINGVKIEGVFPKFDSKFDANLPEELFKSSNAKQYEECNTQLKEDIDKDYKLRNQFSDEQIEQIEDGKTPDGYVWHHNEDPGKMQLVETDKHDRAQGGAAHTGGKALWGGSYTKGDN